MQPAKPIANQPQSACKPNKPWGRPECPDARWAGAEYGPELDAEVRSPELR